MAPAAGKFTTGSRWKKAGREGSLFDQRELSQRLSLLRINSVEVLRLARSPRGRAGQSWVTPGGAGAPVTATDRHGLLPERQQRQHLLLGGGGGHLHAALIHVAVDLTANAELARQVDARLDGKAHPGYQGAVIAHL